MARKLYALVAGLLLLAGSARAASTIDALPLASFPFPDPSCQGANLWLAQNGLDVQATATQAGYIFQGALAPACPFTDELWWNTGASPGPALSVDTGAGWAVVGNIDPAGAWVPPVGGGTPVTIAGAGTTDLGAQLASSITISGSATISSFGSSAIVGTAHFLTFSGASVLTYNAASMILPGAANITTAAGDSMIAIYLGSGNWQIASYQAGGGYLLRVNNLSDVASASASRTNLGLGPIAILGIGAGLSSSGGNLLIPASGVTGAMLAGGAVVANLGFTPMNPANNLADLTNTATARFNLGLGPLSSLGIGAGLASSGGNLIIAPGGVVSSMLATSLNLTGVPTAPTASPGTSTTQIATTAFVTGAIAAPVVATLNSTNTASYTVANADDHSTIYFTGSTPNQTITVNALSTYTDPFFSVSACNQNTRRLTISSADAGTRLLYPNRCVTLQPNTSTGGLVYDRPFEPYVVTAGGTGFHIGPAGACNDANDGLVAGSAGAVCTPSIIVSEVYRDIVCTAGGSAIIVPDDGAYTNFNLAMGGVRPPGCSDQVPIVGSSSANVILNCLAGNPCFDIEDGAITTIVGVFFDCTGATGVFSRGTGAIVDLQLVVSGPCAGGSPISVSDGGHVNMLPDPIGGIGLVITGNSANVITVDGPGSLFSATAGLSVTSNPITVGIFLVALKTGVMNMGLVGGGGSVTGTRWATASNGVIQVGSGLCNSSFANLGSINGASNTGGQCN
jgi:hypothetical protein